MRLVRSIDVPASRKSRHLGPVAGGSFWAIAGLNDLPACHRVASADAAYLLRYGALFIQDAVHPAGWTQISSAKELRQFRLSVVDGSMVDETLRISVVPFLPELYFVPRSWRGRRAVRRAQHRAMRRPAL